MPPSKKWPLYCGIKKYFYPVPVEIKFYHTNTIKIYKTRVLSPTDKTT